MVAPTGAETMRIILGLLLCFACLTCYGEESEPFIEFYDDYQSEWLKSQPSFVFTEERIEKMTEQEMRDFLLICAYASSSPYSIENITSAIRILFPDVYEEGMQKFNKE